MNARRTAVLCTTAGVVISAALGIGSTAAAQGTDARMALQAIVMDLRGKDASEKGAVANAVSALASLGDWVLPLLPDLLGDRSALVRQAALTALRDADAPGLDVERLVPLVNDRRAAIARIAARELGKREGEQVVGALIQVLPHWDEGVRTAAREALAGQPAEVVLARLEEELAEAEGPSQRAPYVRALGLVRARRALELLVEALSEPALVGAALEAFGEGGSRAASHLADWCLANVEGRADQVAAAVPVLAGLGGGKAVKTLARLVGMAVTPVSQRAAEALATMDDEDAIERLVGLATHDDGVVRRAALEALARAERCGSAKVVLANFKHDDEGVRLAALSLVGTCSSRKVRRAVSKRYRRLARRGDPATVAERRAMLRGLGSIGNPKDIPRLRAAAEEKDVQDAAVYGLGLMGAPAVRALVDLLRKGPPLARPAISTALAGVGEPALGVLLELAVDPSRHVRRGARDALAELDVPEAVEPLVSLADDPSTPERAGLVALLAGIQSEGCLDALASFAKSSEDPLVREEAARALGTIEDLRVDTILRSVARADANQRVRCAAVHALVARGDASSIELYTRLLARGEGRSLHAGAVGFGYLASFKDAAELVGRLSRYDLRDPLDGEALGALQRATFQTGAGTRDDFQRWLLARADTPAPPPLERRRLVLDDGSSVATYALGSGEPLLILPGGPDDPHDVLRRGVDPLAVPGRQLVYLDLPGRGASSRPEDGVPDVVDDADAAAEVILRLGLGQVDVLGQGWGAVVAVVLADRHPDRTGKLVLDSPPLPTTAGWEAEVEIAATRTPKPWRDDLLTLSDEDAAHGWALRDRVVKIARLAGSVRDPSALADVVPQMGNDAELAARWIAQLGALDPRPAFERLGTRTLIVMGEDAPASEEAKRWFRLVAANPDVDLLVLRKAGRYPCYERPEDWRAAVMTFLGPPSTSADASGAARDEER